MDQIITVGRRKTSVARVFFRDPSKAGKGKITVNKRELENYFPNEVLRMKIMEPFTVADVSAGDFDILVNVRGGGLTGQAEALRLGICRALVEKDPEHRPALKAEGFLTRDPRMVERKKYGRHKARKAHQFSKR